MKHRLDSIDDSESLYRTKVKWISDNLCTGLGKVDSRFVEEAILGITEGGSVRLTSISRALKEKIPLHATHKRLSRNLGHKSIGKVLLQNLLKLGARQITQDSLLVLYTTDLEKKYAEKMAFLGKLGDQGMDINEGESRKGYEVCEIVGAGYLQPTLLAGPDGEGLELPPRDFVPMAQSMWSRNAPDYLGNSQHIHNLVEEVRRVVGTRGIIVTSQHQDNHALLKPWVESGIDRFIAGQKMDSQLQYRNGVHCVHDLVERCDTPYGGTVFRLGGNRETGIFIHFGFLPVRLPEAPEHPLFLVVLKGLHRPLALLTNEPMRRNRKILQQTVEACFEQWQVKTTNRFFKLDYQFTDIRVLTYERLKNMAALLLVTAYFDSLWPSGKKTLKGIRFDQRYGERDVYDWHSIGSSEELESDNQHQQM